MKSGQTQHDVSSNRTSDGSGSAVASGDVIEVERQPNCVACGAAGTVKYSDLTDRLFGAPGHWTLQQCERPECGALWLDPRPTPREIWKAYRCYYTHGGADPQSLVKRVVRFLARERAHARYGRVKSRLPWPGAHVALLAARLYPGLIDHLDLMIRYQPPPSEQGRTLLDVGCGDGEALEILRDLGWDVQGVEFDPSAVAAAARRGLHVHEGDLPSANFASDSFDLVSSTHVLEHVYDPSAFLSESLRVLKPGGTLITVTPNAAADGHRRHGANWRGLEPPRHIAILTEEALRAMATRAGFTGIQIFTTARAVGLAEIAALGQRETAGVLLQQPAPRLSVRLRGHLRQLIASLRKSFGTLDGEELVLIARK